MSEFHHNSVDFEQLKRMRQWLHAHPELSRQEAETAAYMQAQLKEHAPPDEIISLAGAGFAAVYNGSASGNTVLARTELDALPIHETNNDLAYRSLYDGVAHKCGHDGHMTIIAGLAQIYARQRPARGRIVLLFQPDEETGTGARTCCEHPNFKKIAPDYAFALHNFPGFPKDEILCRSGVFTSAVRYMAIKLSGKEAHSAMPETGASPALAIAEIAQASARIQQSFDTPDERALVVPVRFDMGVPSSGVAPGYGEAHFTLRSPRNEVVDRMWSEFATASEEIASKYRLRIEFEEIEIFSATVNDADAVAMIEDAARLNGLAYTELEAPFRAGEDFGEITRRYKGAMFGLGSGENIPELHNPDYDFPDEIIPSGIAMFKALVDQALEEAS
ncbi:amidohydrolase [Stappia sp. GBMRC 2046]|uniref:Amidohydrolase n=1 Tax=Stappia sediminis TaxID=2692190 RepID=A0A7X3LSB6_9HYPH|nr:amidohydrolase [Stappia sediminis]MXN64205.1 amidohydrolase [Stappia sediminis]